jgi:hypothetical protein
VIIILTPDSKCTIVANVFKYFLANAFISLFYTYTNNPFKVDYTQQHYYDLLKKVIPLRDSNPGLLVLRRNRSKCSNIIGTNVERNGLQLLDFRSRFFLLQSCFFFSSANFLLVLVDIFFIIFIACRQMSIESSPKPLLVFIFATLLVFIFFFFCFDGKSYKWFSALKACHHICSADDCHKLSGDILPYLQGSVNWFGMGCYN